MKIERSPQGIHLQSQTPGLNFPLPNQPKSAYLDFARRSLTLTHPTGKTTTHTRQDIRNIRA